MELDYFLIKERIKQMETSFSKEGWITIYERNNDDLIFPCIVYDSKIEEYLSNSDWVIQPNSGKFCISCEGYATYSDDGYEPFIFERSFNFNGDGERYVDISEDFILYYNLYEQIESKQNRKYFFINEVGDLDEVIKVEPNKIQVKLRFLNEYIAVRKVHFALCFDFTRLANNVFPTNEIKFCNKNYRDSNFFYNHLIRIGRGQGQLQSWIHGKKIIKFDPTIKSYLFAYQSRKYESFITGFDEKGNEEYQDCSDSNDKCFILTYFKKEVLDKYYNEPEKYKVDGFRVCSKFFSLKIDNNNENYVAVFLVELGGLPHNEQLHWKQYNIEPQNGMSYTYYQTMIKGKWVKNSETADLLFKEKYIEFNKKWEEKFGWAFYKPLAKEDEYIFNSLHIPTSNNQKSFNEQILSISKLTIDKLNEAKLSKNITLKEGDKGITKLEKFLQSNQVIIQDMIDFLRNLQGLRSGISAHTFSESNKSCKNAMKYFNMQNDNYIEVAKDIFIKSICTLNTLEDIFLTKHNIES